MRFHGKLNEAEVKEATRLIRPKGYTWRVALTYIRLIVYAAIVIAIVWASIVQHARIPPAVIAIRVALLVVIGGFSIYRFRKSSREAVLALDASLPDTLELSPAGVRHHGPNGAEGFQPWTSYTGFREGQHVVLLRRKEKNLFSVLPVSGLSDGERSNLRGLLQQSLTLLEKP